MGKRQVELTFSDSSLGQLYGKRSEKGDAGVRRTSEEGHMKPQENLNWAIVSWDKIELI